MEEENWIVTVVFGTDDQLSSSAGTGKYDDVKQEFDRLSRLLSKRAAITDFENNVIVLSHVKYIFLSQVPV